MYWHDIWRIHTYALDDTSICAKKRCGPIMLVTHHYSRVRWELVRTCMQCFSEHTHPYPNPTPTSTEVIFGSLSVSFV